MNKTSFLTQLAVGLFFIIGLLIVGYYTIILSVDNVFGTNNSYIVQFEDIGGLELGNTVALRGVPVGKVKENSLGRRWYGKG